MIKRATFQNMFQLAPEIGDWDERQVTPVHSDPQMHMSRSAAAQPFFLICEKDTTVMQATGTGEAEFRYSGVHQTRMTVGDMLYVPGGTPCRIQPHEESIYLRFKAKDPGLEAVAWFCTSCDAEVWRHEFNASDVPAQQGYLDGCERFNADVATRTCGSCQTVQNQVDAAQNRWGEVAELLRAEANGQPTS